MRVIPQRLRVAQVILDFLFQRRLGDRRIERRLGIVIFPAAAGPDPVTPVNVLDSSLLGHALFKAERSLESIPGRFTA